MNNLLVIIVINHSNALMKTWPAWRKHVQYLQCRFYLPCHGINPNSPNSKVHGVSMGPIWGRQDPGGPHIGPMNFALWTHSVESVCLSDCINEYMYVCITHPAGNELKRITGYHVISTEYKCINMPIWILCRLYSIKKTKLFYDKRI